MTIYSFDILLFLFGTSLLFHVQFCYSLTCIQVSQKAGQVVWYSHFFQNCPQFIVIHTVKGFDIVNKAEIDVFLELSCFLQDPADVGNLISGSSAFSKTSLNITEFMVHVLLKAGRGILSITLLACEMSAVVRQFDHSLALPFFGIAMKTDLFEFGATVEFSKYVDTLIAALSKLHLVGFEIVQLEFHHIH